MGEKNEVDWRQIAEERANVIDKLLDKLIEKDLTIKALKEIFDNQIKK